MQETISAQLAATAGVSSDTVLESALHRQESISTALPAVLMLEAAQSRQSREQNGEEILRGSRIVTGIVVGSHGHPESEGQSRAIQGSTAHRSETRTRLRPWLATVHNSGPTTQARRQYFQKVTNSWYWVF